MISSGIDSLIHELLDALDDQINVLESKCSQLAGLSRALVRRDDEATEAILEEMERTEGAQASADLRLVAVRGTFAEAHGCEVQELKLSRLVGELPPRWAQATDHRRRRIVDLTGKLRREHLRTAMLLSECARINRMLLESILPVGDAVVTYGAAGMNLWRAETGLMDTES